MIAKLRLVLSITILFLAFYGTAQNRYWERHSFIEGEKTTAVKQMDFEKTTIYALKIEGLKDELRLITAENKLRKTIYFPNDQGEMIPFSVKESPVLSKELSKKYPEIRSFVGYSLQNSGDRIRFSISHRGIQSMLIYADARRSTFIEKASKNESTYFLYNRNSLSAAKEDFICSTKASVDANSASALKLVDDQLLRTFRVAISTTGEYTQFHGGTVADAMAAINATLTRINEVMETDLGITLELIPNNDLLVFTNPNTDPYNNNFNSEVQSTITSVIGESNYDIGHLLHQDTNNGNAGFIGSVCQDNQKGSAFSSGLTPQGDIFDLDFVAHEMGHQFGANHTWSFESEGTSVQVEPASGTTIMGYAGIVPNNNVAPNGDDYFHYNSIFQITQYLQGVNCAVESTMTNSPPVITAAGNFSIPRSTAFVLTANATDPDTGDVLTYSWEQIDNGVVNTLNFGPSNPSGANFRSLPPTLSPERYFPRLSRVASGNLTQTTPAINSAWETVSDIERELNFALTVRDNVIGGGQVASDLVQINVVNAAGPFTVNSQATPETYLAGSVQTISWDVANTQVAPINAQLVDIFLSTDGGKSYPIMLVEDVANDGSQDVLLPGVATTEARIMVKASTNIFFAVNDSDFTIQETQAIMNFSALDYEICQPGDLAISFSYETFSGFNEEVTFSAPDAPAGLGVAFSPINATSDTNVDITISNTQAVAPGLYPITITANSASFNKEVVINLGIYTASFSDVVLTTPADGTTGLGQNQSLEWEANSSYTSYDVEIATDSAFTNIIESTTVFINTYLPTNLQAATSYFWRVKPKNSCGEGNFGAAFSFTTVVVNCTSRSADDVPITITSSGTPTITSRISFINDLPITDVNVNLNVNHTYLSDLIITLTSPAGTQVVLTSLSCGGFENINATFDDDAAPFVCGTNPAIRGIVRPLGSLASFNGESLYGDWILEINDAVAADGGSLVSFSLDICAEGIFRPDADGDGVFDDGDDLCLGTPPGTEVDTDGCSVFRFPPNNFIIAVESETCIGNNDGSLEIVTPMTMDYTIQISGNGVDINTNFTDNYQLNNLSAATYTLCITGTDGTNDFEEICFEVIISEPEPLSVVSTLSPDGLTATLLLSGSEQYMLELNGEQIQISAPEYVIDLKEGTTSLRVSTDLACQGIYEELFFNSDKPLIYPNPISSIGNVFVGGSQGELESRIFTQDGRLVRTTIHQVNDVEFQLDFTGLSSGIYFVQLKGRQMQETLKVFKQ